MFSAGACDVEARSAAADNGSSSALNARRPGKERHYGGSQRIRLQDKDFLMKNLTSLLLAVSVFGAITCAASLSRASAASTPNSLTVTCAQVQDHIRRHGQTLLATGKESGNYSFDYADCGGTVPGYACTRDEAYCYVGWWCDYNYPAQVNSQVHDQGTESCPARR
jgi:hypothetical protein